MTSIRLLDSHYIPLERKLLVMRVPTQLTGSDNSLIRIKDDRKRLKHDNQRHFSIEWFITRVRRIPSEIQINHLLRVTHKSNHPAVLQKPYSKRAADRSIPVFILLCRDDAGSAISAAQLTRVTNTAAPLQPAFTIIVSCATRGDMGKSLFLFRQKSNVHLLRSDATQGQCDSAGRGITKQ